MRSSHLPFKVHYVGYVRSSLPIFMHVGSIATPEKNLLYPEELTPENALSSSDSTTVIIVTNFN